MNEIVPILEYVLKIGKPLLIIADGIENEALQTLVLNRVKSNLRIVAINAPGHISVRNEILEDIAALTNAEVISSKKGTSFTDAVKCLGSIKRIIVSQRSTTFIGSGKELPRVQERLNSLKTFITDLGSEPNEISIAKMRLARLSGGVAIIRVGGLTETEVIEKRYRIEDALNATKAAIDEGYIPGGGLVLYKIAKKLANVKDDSGALKIFISGCLSPLKTICKNANVSYDVIDTKLENYINDDNNHDIGYNAKKNDIGHLVDEGIIDPVKVTRCAIEHATSITSAFLSLDAAIIEDVK
jgi:chaperonin GroEL